MSLYGKDDSNANKTKAGIGVAKSSQTKTIVFIDDTEAQLAENKGKRCWFTWAGIRSLPTLICMVIHDIRQNS